MRKSTSGAIFATEDAQVFGKRLVVAFECQIDTLSVRVLRQVYSIHRWVYIGGGRHATAIEFTAFTP